MKVQRYEFGCDGIVRSYPDGTYVLYADHAAAVDEAEQRAVAAGVQAAREAVPHEICCWGSDTEPCDCFHASVIAAIDALRGES